MILALHRDAFMPQGVWGELQGLDGLRLQTLENPDTLFPPGVYRCVRDWYHTGGYETFEIIVEGRSRILFHAANYASELEGCVAPGMERGFIGEHIPCVWRSRHAHALYMESVRGLDAHLLHVTEDR